MSLPSIVTSAVAYHWLAAHAGQRALARPLLVLVGAGTRRATLDATAASVRESDVTAQGRRVFANWRRLARVAEDDASRSMREQLEALVASLPARDEEAETEGDAFDLVAFDDAATRVRALAADLPLMGRGHHVLLVNPRRTGLERWLATDSRIVAAPPQLFPTRPGRPATLPRFDARGVPRPPRVRTVCAIRPARADAARVCVLSRWRDEPMDTAPPMPGARARWRRTHTAIALATVFAQLAEVEAGSPAALRA